MKNRIGFVSNSSSSSFCCWGKWTDEEIDDVEELEEKDILYNVSDEDGACLGVEDEPKDNELFGDFKKRVAKKLTDAGFPTKESEITLCSGTFYR